MKELEMKMCGTRPIRSLFFAAIAAFGLSGPAAAQVQGLANPEARAGGTLVAGAIFGLEPRSLNPNIRQDDGALRLAALIHQTLVTTDFVHNTGVHPSLADRWEISPDGLTYTFHLNPNAKWHDGMPVTAEDVKWTYDTIRSQNGGTVRFFAEVDTIEAADQHTVVIRMKNTDASLLGNLGTWNAPFILPKHVYEGQDWLTAAANENPVGSGPFRFVSWQKGSHHIVEANEEFFRGRPAIQRIVTRFYNLPNLITAFETGEVKFVYELLPFSELVRLKRDPNLEIDFHYRGLSSQIQFNLRREPFDDERVRRALAMAVDRTDVSGRVFNDLAPLNASQMPFSWARTDQFDVPRSHEAAEKLLDEAGLPRGSDGVRFRTTMSLAPVMSWPDMATVVVEQWRSIGVEVQIESMDFPALLARVGEQKNFDMVGHNVIIGHEPGELCTFVCSNGARNWGGYNNPRVDELVGKGRRVTDQAERKALYTEMQQLLMDDMFRIYLVEFPYHQPIWAEVNAPFWDSALAGKPSNPYQGFLYTYIGEPAQ
jgi:peptide/nickel transport system substrate-binding protein